MSISVNPLKFPANALEPFISEKTIGFHYGKHLQNYVNTANTLIKELLPTPGHPINKIGR